MSNTKNEPIQFTKYGLAILFIVFLASVLRLYDLDVMAYHHDESIHAFYSHKEFEGDFKIHPYDPTYHGQFLYHFGALFFFLFGDTDTVGRLPFAFVGILMFYFIWRLRAYFDKSAIFILMLAAAFSPTLAYFSRFARNDIYTGVFSLAIFVFALEYLLTLKNRFLIWASFFLVLLYCDKENSYMTGFIYGSYAVFYGIYYYFSYAREGRSRALGEIFRDRAPFVKILTLYALFSCAAFSLVYYVSHQPEFRSTSTLLKGQRGAESYDIGILRDTWNQYMQLHPWFAKWGVILWVLIPVLIAIALFIAYSYLAHISSSKKEEGSWFSRMARNNIAVLACIVLMFGIYTAMFTNFGFTPQGMKSGVIDYLLYWMGQQDAPRIPGPPDYYIPRLLIYEPLLVIFSVLAFIVYTWNYFTPTHFLAFQLAFGVSVYCYWVVALTKSVSPKAGLLIWLIAICISFAIVLGRKFVSLFSFIPKSLLEPEEERKKEENPLVPDGIRSFFIYWSLFSVLIYALLEEKVPWLMVPQVVPLVMLAGVFISDLYRKLGPGVLRNVFVTFVGLLLVFQARAAYQLVLFNPDNPRELMVYTQTDHSLLDVVEEIKEGAKKLGSEYMPPNPTKAIATFQGTAIWPYVWYLRNYMTSSTTDGVPPAGVPFAVVEANLEDNMKVWAKGEYTKRKLVHRGWWPPALFEDQRISTPAMRHEMPFEYARKHNMKPSDGWRMLWNYLAFREIWNPTDRSIFPQGENVLVYSRTPLIAPEVKPQVASGYDQPVRPLQSIKNVGKFGKGDGEFMEPRGVALSPDESKVYILDAMNGRIQVFDPELNFLGWFGGPGSEIGHLRVEPPGDGPNGGIGVGPDGTIYVTDTWQGGSGRINRYTPDGKPLPPLVPTGDSFYFPRGLAVSKEGIVYVADTGNNRIVKFNPDGSYGGVVVKGQMREPVGVAVGPNGWIYVCDVGMRRIASFTPQGLFLKHWPILGWSASSDELIPWIEPYVTIDAAGFVYATDSTKNIIHRFDPNGQQVTQAGGTGSAPFQMRKPKGITVDSKGNLFIADSENNRILKARIQ